MAKPYYPREKYLATALGVVDTEDVKVITGIRRSGKSRLLELIRDEILKKTDQDHAVYLNFEDLNNAKLMTATALNDYCRSAVRDDKTYYYFFDEIQDVSEWEKVVNSLRLGNADIYITGSNSTITSGRLATKLTGRTFPIEMSPLSFQEFIDFRQRSGFSKLSGGLKAGYPEYDDALKAELEEFISVGGFPLLSTHEYSQTEIKTRIEEIHNTVVLRDVIQRHEIKNVQLLERIIAFVYDNVGGQLSILSIAKYLKSQQRKGADHETIANYLKYLEEAFVIGKAQRFDIRGKQLLETNNKYYLGDHSLQYALRGHRQDKVQGILENIVYLELVRRGYTVTVGKMKVYDDEQKKEVEKEVDFVAEKDSDRIYVQVSMAFSASKETYKREFSPLLAIKDSFPKYVVTLDKFWQVNDNGVKGIHMADFLLKAEF
jgi:predicted AAA+ superfamily ATPase